MNSAFRKNRCTRTLIIFLVFAIIVPPLLLTEDASAKRGGDKEHRTRFYGLVQSMPNDSLQGEWVFGGRTVEPDAATEFHQKAGPLKVGGCAKVDLRNGRVHGIESQPAHDCR